MNPAVALIGFGEAGSTFARAARWQAQAWDIKRDRRQVMIDDGVLAAKSAAAALVGAPLVLSLVTADQALVAAETCASLLTRGALWCDMNSVAPETKQAAARVIEAAGGRYVDVAVLAPVDPARLAVPLLISGPHAEAGAAALAELGFTNVRIVGEDVGRAATIKMLRSVMYKGMEALTAECLIACEKAGVTDEVLGSFANDWASGADYRLDRMMVHGLRRAAEMYESSQTLESLGVAPLLTEGTVGWQQAMGELGVSPVPEGLKAKLAAIMEKMP